MSQTQVTMRDVARTAGVHPGTVSRVLNPRTRPLVNPATADRVEQVAREMGYSLNPIARGLKTRRTFSVGVLIPDLTNPLFPPIIRGIERVLDAAGYTALVASTDGEPARERQRLEALIARQVDGFVIATAQRRHPVVADAIASELAVVLVNRTIEGEGVFAVVPDDRRGSAMAVDHLAALGHTRIAHIAGPQQTTTGLLRYRGFVEAMEDAGVAPDRDLIAQGDAFTIAAGAQAARELLAAADPPTGIVAANDLLALGAYTALAEAGLRLPRRRVGGRLQRHAVRRPLRAAAHDRPHPPRPHRRPRRRAPARADRGSGRDAADARLRADPQGAGLDGGTGPASAAGRFRWDCVSRIPGSCPPTVK